MRNWLARLEPVVALFAYASKESSRPQRNCIRARPLEVLQLAPAAGALSTGICMLKILILAPMTGQLQKQQPVFAVLQLAHNKRKGKPPGRRKAASPVRSTNNQQRAPSSGAFPLVLFTVWQPQMVQVFHRLPCFTFVSMPQMVQVFHRQLFTMLELMPQMVSVYHRPRSQQQPMPGRLHDTTPVLLPQGHFEASTTTTPHD